MKRATLWAHICCLLGFHDWSTFQVYGLPKRRVCQIEGCHYSEIMSPYGRGWIPQ